MVNPIMFRNIVLLEEQAEYAQPISLLLSEWAQLPVRLSPEDVLAHDDSNPVPELIILGPSYSGSVRKDIQFFPALNLIPLLQIYENHKEPPKDLAIEANARVPWSLLFEELRPALMRCHRWREEAARSDLKGEILATFPSDSQYLEKLLNLLDQSWLLEGLSFDETRKLFLAVKEMGINAIEWGNRRNLALPVRVIIRRFSDRVEVIIRDQGKGFDPKKLPHAACQKDPLKHVEIREARGIREGGFGILMTRGLVDELTFNETGNEVRLKKKLPC